jgi:hypothetical protein
MTTTRYAITENTARTASVTGPDLLADPRNRSALQNAPISDVHRVSAP